MFGDARPGDHDVTERERAYIEDRTRLVMPVLAIEVEPSDAPLLVTADSPLAQREAVAAYGYAIKREMRYDCALADANPEYFGDQRAWLLPSRRILTRSFTAAGVVSFIHDDRIGWTLTWMYLHPYERGSGLVEQMWPYFVRAYGNDFRIDEPISPAAHALLNRIGHPTGSS